MRSRAKAALYFAGGIALVAGLLLYVGPSWFLVALQEAELTFLALAFVTYAAFFLMRGLRWKLLFSKSAPDVRVSSTTSVSAIGWLANSILPFKSGDVLRAALLARRERVALATSAATVGLERVLDLVGLAIVAAVGLLLLPRAATLPAGLERALTIVWVLPLLALVTLAVLVRWRAPTVRLAERILRPFGKPGRRLVAFGDTVLAGLHALARSPALLLHLAPYTLAISATQALIFAFLVLAFLPGTPFLLAYAGAAVFLLSFVVSITPGNIGTYEAAFAAVFIALGVAPELAVPASILTHVTTTLTVAILGGLGLAAFGRSTGESVPFIARASRGGAPR